MITKPLFRKNFLVFSGFILVAIFIAFASSFIIMSFERKEHEREMMNRPMPKPGEMMHKMFVLMDRDPFIAVKNVQTALESDAFFQVDLVDASGKSLTNNKNFLPEALSAKELEQIKTKPLAIGGDEMRPQFQIFSTPQEGTYFVVNMRGPRMGGPRGGPPGPGPGGPGDMRGPHMGPPPGGPMGPPPGPNPLVITVVALIACVLISLGIALFYQFSKYRERATEAFAVLSELKHGNLAARMPVKRFDELAPLVSSFNLMADDLERMVENLRKSDHARRQLLQDLAHDLRTPLASLKTFLEALKNSSAKMSAEKREEVISLCFSEVDYFGRLVEDLLFLAQITEPKYSPGTEEIILMEKIAEQVNVFKHRYPNLKYEITAQSDLASHPMVGSPQLIERLLRNSFENSSSFAKNKVHVNYETLGESIRVQITDDGPGFSAEALKEFGHKKSRRVLSTDPGNQRISVGIGSVIMKEILELHSGVLSAENVSSEDGIVGGRITLTLPKL
jgi:signal transduction histidine kinase